MTVVYSKILKICDQYKLVFIYQQCPINGSRSKKHIDCCWNVAMKMAYN